MKKLENAKGRLFVGVFILVTSLAGCWVHSVLHPVAFAAMSHPAHVVSDTGQAAKYDRCTYLAFVHHTSPTPCYKYLPEVQP